MFQIGLVTAGNAATTGLKYLHINTKSLRSPKNLKLFNMKKTTSMSIYETMTKNHDGKVTTFERY
jgi:hypothetical protein